MRRFIGYHLRENGKTHSYPLYKEAYKQARSDADRLEIIKKWEAALDGGDWF